MLLKRGSKGDDVIELQNQLNKLGYSLEADGIFGGQTETAVKDFQSKNGLDVDGIVGSVTDAEILEQIGNGAVTSEPFSGVESKLKIVREEISSESTIGSLYLNGEFFCYTLELPWKDNKNRISCIPTGNYPVVERSAAASTVARYPHLHIQDVPGRSYILVHRGNTAADILGCVLVGESKGTNRVNNSTGAMNRLMATVSGTKITMEIVNA